MPTASHDRAQQFTHLIPSKILGVVRVVVRVFKWFESIKIKYKEEECVFFPCMFSFHEF